MNKFIINVLTLLFLLPAVTYGQKIAVKTNVLYLATSTPNIGVEFALSEKITLSLTGAYNPFNLSSNDCESCGTVQSKIKHYLVMPELKYWTSQSFQRSFFGLHGIVGHYNMAAISFIKPLKDYRYQGNAYGAGISYGYNWAIGKRWGLEASAGVGYLRIDYKKYEKEKCGEFIGNFTHDYWGPTKLGLSLIYFID